MDMQIVVTALPTIAGELGNLHLFGWVGSAYLLSTAAVAPFYGKLGDMFGRKNVVLTAIVLFLLGSLACGMAWSMESLIAARVLQGIGGGGLMVSAFAIIGELFAPRDRAKYQGYTSAVFTLSSVLGPVAGGYITDFFGWRWVFLVNLPIGIVGAGASSRWRCSSKSSTQAHKVDYLGGVLLALATDRARLLGRPCARARRARHLDLRRCRSSASRRSSRFIIVERRAAEPIIPLRLFRNHTITLVTVVSLIAGMCDARACSSTSRSTCRRSPGFSPAEVGFLFLPASAASLVVSMLAGRHHRARPAATSGCRWSAWRSARLLMVVVRLRRRAHAALGAGGC